jgi:hypothetical protein
MRGPRVSDSRSVAQPSWHTDRSPDPGRSRGAQIADCGIDAATGLLEAAQCLRTGRAARNVIHSPLGK